MTYEKIQELVEPVYVEAGAGLLDCQRFEAALKHLLLCLARLGIGDFDRDYVERVFEGDVKKTAGQLLAMLKDKVDVTSEAEQILAQGIASRNLFIHSLLMDNIEKVLETASRNALVLELRSVRGQIQEAEHKLRPLVASLARVAGIGDMDAVRQAAVEAMLRGEGR